MRKLLSLTGILLASALLVACGGGSGPAPAADVGGGSNAPQTATVGIVLTDNDADDYCEAIATITDISLLGENGRQDVYTGSMVVDLLKLRDYVELVEVVDEVEPDTISKIRLQLSSLVLTKCDDEGNADETIEAKLAGNGKIDLKPNDKIEISPNDVLFMTLDFDMDKSLKITEAGNSGKVIVRPVIFVKAGTLPGFKGGITRVSGEITRINEAGDVFLLCTSDLMATPLNADRPDVQERCVKVALDERAGLFGSDGLPVRPSALMVGDAVTVVGTLGPPDDDPVTRLVPLSDANGQINDDSDSDSDSDDGNGDRPPLQFVLKAIVVEIGAPGTFASLRGELGSGISEDGEYRFTVGGGQGFALDTMLLGQLFETSRIIDPKGNDVDRSLLSEGDGALVDGVILLSDAEGGVDTLRTALMLVRARDGIPIPPELEEEILVGKVLGVNPDEQVVNIATDQGDRCMLADDATVLFVFEDKDGEGQIVEGKITDLAEGAVVVNFGVEDEAGCFDADTILSRAAPKPPSTEPT
ncbi:MAG: DUF4382 domain-containing protein [Gammaproteobacteria bacterium]|nr:DUF4382 domain-containing protein [Gammaproteobacteria bacterium]NND36507.1 DUF4382 domain-containing protein [Gammaproteobacteria bacterium]